MDVRTLFHELEASNEFERDSSGGEEILAYHGRNDKGDPVIEWVKRTDINYLKDGEIYFSVYYVIERDGKFEDIVIHDKKNNIHYQNLYYDNE